MAFCVTGSGGMGAGTGLIEEDVYSWWHRNLKWRMTSNMRTLTTVAGQQLKILGEIVVDFGSMANWCIKTCWWCMV